MRIALGFLLSLMCLTDAAQAVQDKIVVSGTVPTEAMRAQVLSRLRDLYGAEKITDQMEVGNVVAPANWDQYVLKMLSPNLRNISAGQVQVEGKQIRVSGNVKNEALRQEVTSTLASSFNQTYQVHNTLQVSSGQQALDETLGQRTIEFESGSAILTAKGRIVLDEMAQVIRELNNARIAIIGHTDNVGLRESNIELSLARAAAVRQYLIGKRIESSSMSVTGSGPDAPIADNSTVEGRSKNRRIDFKILN